MSLIPNFSPTLHFGFPSSSNAESLGFNQNRLPNHQQALFIVKFDLISCWKTTFMSKKGFILFLSVLVKCVMMKIFLQTESGAFGEAVCG